MSGMAGWVDYGRDVRTQGTVLRSMVGTLANRGSDADGVWLGEHAGLGHRRLAVLDRAGADQPASVRVDGRTVATVSYGGQLDNLIADGTSPVLSLLDTSSSRALEPARRDMELVLSLHDWLSTSGARLDLAQ